jgi:cytochrome c-type biogenesis protein CcmH/NrfF
LKGSFISSHRLGLVGVLCLAMTILPAAGDNSTRIERLGHRMMCACGCNQILLECNHVGCTYSSTMRDELVSAVNAGNGDGAVLQSFVEKYGSTVLAAPTNSGFNRVAWLMPYVALAIGVAGVVLVVRNWKTRPMPAPAGNSPTPRSSDLDRFREQARRETDL